MGVSGLAEAAVSSTPRRVLSLSDDSHHHVLTPGGCQVQYEAQQSLRAAEPV
jgi:hypothetical protein